MYTPPKRRKLTKAERQTVYNKCGGHCAYCGCDLAYKDMQADHVKALHTCGADDISNMLPACRSCNHYKSTLGLDDFRVYLAGLHNRMLRDNVNYRTLNRFGIIQQAKAEIQFFFEKEAQNE